MEKNRWIYKDLMTVNIFHSVPKRSLGYWTKASRIFGVIGAIFRTGVENFLSNPLIVKLSGEKLDGVGHSKPLALWQVRTALK